PAPAPGPATPLHLTLPVACRHHHRPPPAPPPTGGWKGTGTTGKPGPPRCACCPGPRDRKVAQLRHRPGGRRGRRSEGPGYAGPECLSPGEPSSGPCGPTPRRRRDVPRSHDPGVPAEGRPGKPRPGLSASAPRRRRARLPRDPRSWGSNSTGRPQTVPGAAAEGPPWHCPAARASGESTAPGTCVTDSELPSESQRVIAKSSLSPSPEGWGGHFTGERRCHWAPVATVGAPWPDRQLRPPPAHAPSPPTGTGRWCLPPPEPPEPSTRLTPSPFRDGRAGPVG
ncbi:basic proline-rich protein-like, partial [Eumetopias jubatus]|uniref:basic proline-rich protein-like n=1 Tax=Eumetopias jubatus TaxID=34886 RepID=UPI00101601EF